jgi:hypothetical protein
MIERINAYIKLNSGPANIVENLDQTFLLAKDPSS